MIFHLLVREISISKGAPYSNSCTFHHSMKSTRNTTRISYTKLEEISISRIGHNRKRSFSQSEDSQLNKLTGLKTKIVSSFFIIKYYFKYFFFRTYFLYTGNPRDIRNIYSTFVFVRLCF